jgi:hypothetical protein
MYTEESLREELAKIYRNPADGFMWEQTKSAGITLDDIARYCWTAYSKARTASGPQVIGRITDLHETLQKKMANIVKGKTLLDEGTEGNILKMDKWCLVLNDCWLLGGIHRGAPFHLMSMPTWRNVWAPDYNGFVVTARELIGLKIFGYEREVGPGVRNQVAGYVSRNSASALASCLEDYQLEVALRESRGPIGATDLIA